MVYEYIFLTHNLEDMYEHGMTSRWWRHGIETVKCYDGARVVRLLNSKYTVVANGVIGWATPEELENILRDIVSEYSRRTGTKITIKKIPGKTYLGVGSDKYYWSITRYHLVSNAPLNYYALNEMRNKVREKLHHEPLTNETPKPEIASTSFYPEKNKADVGEPVPLHIYIVLTRKPDTKYPIKLDIRYWDKDTTPPLNMRTKWKPVKEITIHAEPGEDRVSRTINIAFEKPGKYHVIVYACVIDECWTGTYDKEIIVEETPTQIIQPQPTEQPTPAPQPATDKKKKIIALTTLAATALSLYYLFKRG